MDKQLDRLNELMRLFVYILHWPMSKANKCCLFWNRSICSLLPFSHWVSPRLERSVRLFGWFAIFRRFYWYKPNKHVKWPTNNETRICLDVMLMSVQFMHRIVQNEHGSWWHVNLLSRRATNHKSPLILFLSIKQPTNEKVPHQKKETIMIWTGIDVCVFVSFLALTFTKLIE